jgi:hypothetical protein
MLTKGDDYPIHQSADPVALAGTDRNFYDRYFFNGYERDGDRFFAAALGVYPHLNVMDAAFSFIVDGSQHNLYASRNLHMERMDTRVGPISVEVVTPLSVLTVRVDDPDRGIRAELTFESRFPAIQEPRFVRRVGSLAMMDYTRLTQNGCWRGWIELDDRRHDVALDAWWGTRDRSWGIRPVGMRDPQVNPYAGTPQFFWLWAPLNFDEKATFYHLNAEADGTPWNTAGRIVDADGVVAPAMVTSDLEFASGTRHAAGATLTLGEATIELRPRQTFYMKGIGYGHADWSHGLYHGELNTGYETFDLAAMSPADPTHFHIQAICEATLTSGSRTEKGKGILEQLVIGPYEPYGFREVVDLAP